jgi:phasin family protein
MSDNNPIVFITQAQKTGMDAFLAISNAYLLSNERLSMLNAAAIRDSVVEAAAMAKLLADVKNGQEIQNVYSSLTNGLFAKANAYTKNVLELVVQTQDAVGRLQQQNTAGASATSKAAEMWTETISAMTKSLPSWVPSPFTQTLTKHGNSKNATQIAGNAS